MEGQREKIVDKLWSDWETDKPKEIYTDRQNEI
jgi:hypothetical protein